MDDTLQQTFAAALKQQMSGDTDAAAAVYVAILKQHPNHAGATHYLGLAAHQRGRGEEAVALMRKSIELEPTSSHYHNNLGIVLRQQRDRDGAIGEFTKATQLDPHFSPAWANLSNALRLAGKFSEAIAAAERSVAITPESPDAHNNLAAALREAGHLSQAEAEFRVAIHLKGNFVDAISNLGGLLAEMGRPQEGLDLCLKAIALAPNRADAHVQLADVLARLARLDEAKAAYGKALSFDPTHALAWNHLGNTLAEEGNFKTAVDAYRHALAARPDFAEAHNNLGHSLQQLAMYDAANDAYHTALRIKPDMADVRANRALLLLLHGDYRKGWGEYEWRWQAKTFPVRPRGFPQPVWDGSDIARKTILLHAEQGLGDTIQFARYATLVAARGARVVMEVQPEVVDLVRTIAGVSEIVAGGQPLPEFDVHCPLMSLPRIFQTTTETVPAQVPYLSVDEKHVARWAAELPKQDGVRNIGIVWAGRPEHRNDRNRSMRLSTLAPLADVPGVKWFSVQKGPAAAQLADAPFAIEDLGSKINDFVDTAAIVSQLDLVIGVDTSVVHLAGALAKPVWTLLPFSPDFRWLLKREDTPWYPTMRLFRQPQPGDWATVAFNVRQALLG